MNLALATLLSFVSLLVRSDAARTKPDALQDLIVPDSLTEGLILSQNDTLESATITQDALGTDIDEITSNFIVVEFDCQPIPTSVWGFKAKTSSTAFMLQEPSPPQKPSSSDCDKIEEVTPERMLAFKQAPGPEVACDGVLRAFNRVPMHPFRILVPLPRAIEDGVTVHIPSEKLDTTNEHEDCPGAKVVDVNGKSVVLCKVSREALFFRVKPWSTEFGVVSHQSFLEHFMSRCTADEKEAVEKVLNKTRFDAGTVKERKKTGMQGEPKLAKRNGGVRASGAPFVFAPLAFAMLFKLAAA